MICKVGILSPHLDDAALCLGGFIGMLSLNSSSCVCEIINLFTQSVYVNEASRPNILTEQVTALRRQEEACFLQLSGVNQIDLNLPDSSFRGISDEQEVQLIPTERETAEIIQRMNTVGPFDFVFCPSGVGNHIDHLITIALGSSFESKGIPVVFYEDLPYAIAQQGMLDSFDGRLSKRYGLNGVSTAVFDINHGMKKRRFLECYSSQLTSQDIDAVLDWTAKYGERLFFSKASSDPVRKLFASLSITLK